MSTFGESRWDRFEKEVRVCEIAPGRYTVRIVDVENGDPSDPESGEQVIREPLTDLGRAILIAQCVLKARSYDCGLRIKLLQPEPHSLREFPELVEDFLTPDIPPGK